MSFKGAHGKPESVYEVDEKTTGQDGFEVGPATRDRLFKWHRTCIWTGPAGDIQITGLGRSKRAANKNLAQIIGLALETYYENEFDEDFYKVATYMVKNS